MKKLLILCFILVISGCKKSEDISFIIPKGNPELAAIYLHEDDDYFIDIVNGPDPLVAAFGSSSHDVIFAPLTLGTKFFNTKEDYQLLGVITWGNYFIISESSLELDDLKNEKVYVFGQNQVSDILMKAINEHYALNLTFEYLDSLASAAAHSLLHPDDYVLISDPSYSQVMMSNPLLQGLNLDDLYDDMTSSFLPQAGVFVKSDASQSTKMDIKEAIIHSIYLLKNNPDEAVLFSQSQGITWHSDILKSIFLSNQILWMDALDAKASVETLLNFVLLYQPVMISNKLPNDQFYVGD
ncbi:MAG: hypothetical protein EP317_03880 [Bacillota bacterium]|nr:MAG: hypothetical protein EP317_03880 [Bacillota bacterium]